jgi:D-alanyl-D-alanine carboxypeptidase (penicillin-binding protein 5/6)
MKQTILNKRSVIAVVLMVLAVELILTIPVLLLTPAGSAVYSYLHPIPPTPTPTPQPILTPQGTPPTTASAIAYLLDNDTNHVLMNVQGTKRVPMASTTKIMTAVIALEKAKPDDIITVKEDAITEVVKNMGSNANLVAGEKIRMIDMLYALMLPSGDDAAITIADTISGSSQAFVTVMNTYAKKLGLKNTHYINPDGLTYYDQPGQKPDPNHYSTAEDLAKLTRYAMKNPMFEQIVKTQTYVIPQTADHNAHTWTNTDDLIQEYPGVIGIKTGHTVEAGYCLVFAATNGQHTLIGVVLDGQNPNDRFTDAQAMLTWGFNLPLRPPPMPAPTPTKQQATMDAGRDTSLHLN